MTIKRYFNSTPVQIALGAGIVLVASVLLLAMRPIQVTQTCAEKAQQLRSVAAIATVTQQLPGAAESHDYKGSPIPIRTVFGVNPNFCK